MSTTQGMKHLAIYVSQEEYNFLWERAEAMGFVARSSGQPKIAPYLRQKALSKNEEIVRLEGLDALIQELLQVRKTGSNLNQLMSLLNEMNLWIRENAGAGDTPKPYLEPEHLDQAIEVCAELKAEFEKIQSEMMKITEHIDELKHASRIFC